MLQTCIVALFGVQFFSARLATNTETLFPYDLVLIAGEGEEDDALLRKLEETDGVEAEVYPMVRVSGSESDTAGIGSQNIGISESTYHLLKKK